MIVESTINYSVVTEAGLFRLLVALHTLEALARREAA